MKIDQITQYIFLVGLLGLVGYAAWRVLFPFVSALALATIIAVLCYPLYEFVLRFLARQHRSLAALISTLVVFVAVVVPVYFISSLLVNEVASFYRSLDSSNQLYVDTILVNIEDRVQVFIPNFELNLTSQIRQSAEWFTRNIGAIFVGTVSVIFFFVVSLLGSFYLFRDGPRFIAWLVSISPLPENENRIILNRLAKGIRTVVTGSVLLSIIQGAMATIGFSLFGIERAILWGTLGALGSLLPGIGTTVIMIPAIIYLFFTAPIGYAIGLLIWGALTVVLVDNFIGPQLMSRGNNLHPFVILLAVLGGLSVFGPIGFILGPVIVTLFVVLLEIYIQMINRRREEGG